MFELTDSQYKHSVTDSAKDEDRCVEEDLGDFEWQRFSVKACLAYLIG